MSLNLWNNDLGPKGAKSLAEALESGKAPQGLSLSLESNNLGPEGAKALAEALRSGRAPQGLSLNLWNNRLGPKEAKALAEALQSDERPKYITIKGVDWLSGKLGQAAKAVVTFGEAWHYERGIGVKQDFKKAFELYEQAAKLRHQEAQQQIDRLKQASKSARSPGEIKQSAESVQLGQSPQAGFQKADKSIVASSKGEAPASPQVLKPEILEQLSNMQHLLSLSVEDVEGIRALPGLKERFKTYDVFLGQVKLMMDEEGLDAKSQSERAIIHQFEPLLEYYNRLRQNLNQVFLAAQVIAIEMVANNGKTAVDYGIQGAGMAKSVDYIVKGVEHVAAELPIPGIKTIGKILNFGLEQASEIFKSRAVNALARIASSPTEFAKITETFARRVTLIQEDELLKIDNSAFDDQGLSGLKDKAKRAYSNLQKGEKVTPLQKKAEELAEQVIIYTMNQKMKPCPQNLIEGTVEQWLVALNMYAFHKKPPISIAPVAIAVQSVTTTVIVGRSVAAASAANKEEVKEFQERLIKLEQQASPQKAQDTFLARFEAMEKQIARLAQEKEELAAKVKQLEAQSPSSISVGGGGQVQMLLSASPRGLPQEALQAQVEVIAEIQERLYDVEKTAFVADVRSEEALQAFKLSKQAKQSKAEPMEKPSGCCSIL